MGHGATASRSTAVDKALADSTRRRRQGRNVMEPSIAADKRGVTTGRIGRKQICVASREIPGGPTVSTQAGRTKTEGLTICARRVDASAPVWAAA